MSPNILLIESSTEVCSIGLIQDNELAASIESDAHNVHTEQMTIMITELLSMSGLKPLELSAIAVSDGPGSYTSLRVGMSVAKGLCYALEKPLITIGSLEILAYGVPDTSINPNTVIIPMIDARRMEVYAAIYNCELIRVQPTTSIILDRNWYECLPDDQNVVLCGNGAIKAKALFRDKEYIVLHSAASAAFMVKPALRKIAKKEFSDVAYHTPYYHKDPNITQSTKKIF